MAQRRPASAAPRKESGGTPSDLLLAPVADELRRLRASARWALRLSWSVDRRLMIGIAVVTVVNGLLPAGLALVVRGLLNTVAEALQAAAGAPTALWVWLGLGMTLTLVGVTARQLDGLFDRRLRDKLGYRVNSDMLDHAAGLDVAFFDDPHFHDVMQRARDGTSQNVHDFFRSLLRAASATIEVGSLFVILAAIEPLVLPLFAILAAPYAFFQARLAGIAYTLERSRTTQRRWTRYFVAQLTTAATAAEVRLLRIAPHLASRFRTLTERMLAQDWRLQRQSFLGSTTFGLLGTFATYALFVRVALRALEGQGITIGDVAIFGGAATGLRNAIESLVFAARNCRGNALFVSNLIEFLDLSPRLSRSGGGARPALQGEVEFQDVCFSYPGSERRALDGVSLRIGKGETVALVGENGSGKTTLVKLLARLYDPEAGRILIDGHDLRELDLDHLHGEISFVFQGFGRYEATARENVAYGDWERLLDDPAAVEEIARRAGLENVIRSMPHGLDTTLGRRFGEHNLSAGQWQQLAVARAFARNGSILIFDEPTANLDARAEYRLFRRFRALAQGRTTILVSHRFSTVETADRIVVMHEGCIEESGSHEELLANGGRYATLHRMQRARISETDDAALGEVADA